MSAAAPQTAATAPDAARTCSATPDAAEAAGGVLARPAPAYTIEVIDWRRPAGPTPGHVVYVTLLLHPFGLLLSDAQIVAMPCGLRVVFPRRGIVAAGELRRHSNGDPVTIRPTSFPSRHDWEQFSIATIAAIRDAFPDALPPTFKQRIRTMPRRA